MENTDPHTCRELFRLELNTPFDVTRQENVYVANWDEIPWDVLITQATIFTNLTIEVLGISQDQVEMQKYEILETNPVFGIRVMIVDAGQDLDETTRSVLDSALTHFSSAVLDSPTLFKDAQPMIGEDIRIKVDQLVQLTLDTFGGKKISSPMKLMFGPSAIDCQGTFNPRPPIKPADPIEKHPEGTIDKITFSSNSIILVTTEDPVTILFDKHRYFHELVEIFKWQTKHKFFFLKSMDAKGRTVNRLFRIGEKIQDEALLC